MNRQGRLLRLAALLLALFVPSATWLFISPQPITSEEIPTDQREKDKPSALSLSVKDAVLLALDNNLTIPGKQIEWKIADTDIQAARGAYDPTLYGEAYYGETVSPGSSVPLLGGILGGEETRENKRRGRVGVQGKLPPGTVVDLYYSSERVETDTELLLFTPYNPTYNTELNMSIKQPLLRKAWLKYGTADERIARNRRSRAHLAIAQAAEAMVADVEVAYWDLVSVMTERELRLKSLELTGKFYEDVRAKLKLGHATEVDLRSAETDIALQRESLAIVEQQIRDGQNRLRHLVVPFKYPLAENVAVIPLDKPATLVKRPDLTECVDGALKNRREIQMKDVELQNAKVSLDKADSELLPNLELRLTATADRSPKFSTLSIRSGRRGSISKCRSATRPRGRTTAGAGTRKSF